MLGFYSMQQFKEMKNQLTWWKKFKNRKRYNWWNFHPISEFWDKNWVENVSEPFYFEQMGPRLVFSIDVPTFRAKIEVFRKISVEKIFLKKILFSLLELFIAILLSHHTYMYLYASRRAHQMSSWSHLLLRHQHY